MILNPFDPEVIAEAKKSGVPEEVIEFAQNGPAGQPNKIGGMPGGPFRSGAKTRGAP